MLKKLIKHEFKNTFLEIGIINGLIIFFIIITAIFYALDLSTLVILPISSLSILYGASYILLIINIIKSFNQKLFTNEGYLTLTIPVSIDKLLITKILVNFIWCIVTIVVTFFSIFSITYIILDGNFEIFALFPDISINSFSALFIFAINVSITILTYMVILLLTLCILNIGKIKKMKLLVGFIIYYIINTAMTYATYFLPIVPFALYYNDGLFIGRSTNSNILDLFITGEPLEFIGYQLVDFTTLLINIAGIILFYLFAKKLITKKLELE